MHLFNKTLGFMAVLCVMPAAFAATARTTTSGTTGRVSIAGSTARMPNLVLNVSNGKSAVSTTTTTSSSLLADKDCIDSYTECVKGSDACGENFEECTNKVLFHAQMPDCLSTLAQCSSSGVNSLFGTTNISALSNVASTNSYGEVTDYTYPTDGSVLGQMITAAAISNRYDTSTCVRRYTSCLKKESVCGAYFELCTTDKEFRKQRVFCDSTLARCQGDGVKELLGSTTPTANPTKSSRVGELISEGAALAAVKAVATCYKTVDNCILSACAENPYKCYENSNQSVVELVDAINKGTPVTTELVESIVNKSTIAAYIKGQCLDTVGSSKYCYATFIGNGQMPTNSQLRDEDNQEEIYDEAYASRMNAAMKTKIAELVDKFDTKAKAKCTETVKSCAMRVCGGGIGAACYSAVFGNASKSVNGPATYDEIKTGCAAVVNTDANCKYAAANPNSTGTYSYTYINRDAFDVLFPEYDNGAENDVIGVVATLNAALSTNYNDAAIANMKKQCQNVAASCVRSMCGNDFVNCYRNRTDVYSGLTNTGEETFDRSMNKVGGVLDYTVVLGLCLDTVKNATVCEEHLGIEAAKLKLSGAGKSNTWSTGSVRNDWIDAGAATSIKGEDAIYATDENGNNLCRNKTGARGICNTMAPDKSVYDEPIIIGYETYIQSQAAESLFKDLIFDIEKEAQATYNAKLTKEQNMCMASNNGGLVGNRDLGSTFMWVKLKSNKVPTSYSVEGLKTSQFEASNDLYGSFCRVRVTLQSDDKKIQEYMKNKSWTTAYFATGDSFTCGSWIPEKDLTAISEEVAREKLGLNGSGDLTSGQKWGVAGATILSAIAGGVGTDLLQTKAGLGGLLKTTSNTTKTEQAKRKGSASHCTELAADLKTKANVVKEAGETATDDEKKAMMTAAENLRHFIVTTVNKYEGVYVSVTGLSGTDAASLTSAANTVAKECESGLISETNTDGEKFWNNGGGRAVMDVAGAGLAATIGGVTTAQIIKSVNQKKLTAEQQEWMNNVGRHITCYIGSDEAGNYGDMLSTSLE